MTASERRFDVVIVSYNTRDLLRDCLAALRTQEGVAWRAIVVDNGSCDGSVAMVRAEFPEVVLVETGANLGFAAGTNRGIALTGAPYVLLLNSDTRIRPGCLATMLQKLAAEPDIGLLAARLRNPDGSPQASCVPARFPWAYSSPERDCDLIWASAAALVVRRECYEAIGGLDENFFYTGEDCDWGLRARKAKWRVAYSAEAAVVHIGAASGKQVPDKTAEGLHFGRQYFYDKHYGAIGHMYARLHSTVELLGMAIRGPAERRAFHLGLLRRTLAYQARSAAQDVAGTLGAPASRRPREARAADSPGPASANAAGLVILWLVVAFITAIALPVVAAANLGISPGTAFRWFAEPGRVPENVKTGYVVVTYLWICITAASLWTAIGEGLRIAFSWKRWLDGWAVGLGGLAILTAIEWACGWVHVQPGAHLAWPGLLTAALVATAFGVSEEAIFRGFVFGMFRKSMRPVEAVWGSAALFALLHFLRPVKLGDIALPFAILASAGALLAASRLRTGSIWLGVGLHSAWIWFITVNGQQGLLQFLDAAKIWTGGGSPASGLLGLAGIGATYFWLRVRFPGSAGA